MKRMISMMLLLSIALLSVNAQKECKVLSKSEGSITFEVDRNLPLKPLDIRPVSGKGRAESLMYSAAKFTDSPQKFSFDGPDIYKYRYVTSSFREDSLYHFGEDEAYSMFTYAYANHCSLVLSPDIIWMLLCQGFAAHVGANAEELRDMVVSHEDKKELTVISKKDLLNEDADWQTVINGFADEMNQYVKDDLVGTMTADYSTTGVTERIASQMTLMSALKDYFTYKTIYMGCGIPSITLEGTPKDWRKVLDKAMKLKKYNLGWWTKELKPILQEFVTASEGHPDLAFWKNIIMKARPGELRSAKGCGVVDINDPNATPFNGWFLKFFPYCNDKGDRTPEKVDVASHMMMDVTKADMKYVIVDSITETEAEFPMVLLSGFVGVEVDKATHTMKPKIGWVVGVERSEEENAEAKAKEEAKRDSIGKKIAAEIHQSMMDSREKDNLLLDDTPEVKAQEETFSDGRFLYHVTDSAKVGISSLYADSLVMTHPRYGGTLTIPGSVEHEGKTYEVTKIMAEGFEGCDMEHVVISEGVETIGKYAFSGCMHLQSISIPASVRQIDMPVACMCDELTSITVNDFNQKYDSRNNCNGVIESVNNKLVWGIATTKIPKTVKAIGNDAYNSCTALREMHIPEGVEEVYADAFHGCINLKTLYVPSTISNFAPGAMGYTNKLERIVVSPDNEDYDSREDCNAIIDKYDDAVILGCAATRLPSDILSLGDWSFAGTNIRNIDIPEGVENIGYNAFYCCHQLESVTLPDSLEWIGADAFFGCTNLKSIRIPAHVENIESAFRHCIALTTIEVDEANEVYHSLPGSNAVMRDDELVLGCRGTVIPEGVKTIGTDAFYDMGLTEISIPASVESIDYEAFDSNPDLIKITVDENNPVYDSRGGCNALIETASNAMIIGCKTTVIPESVTYIRRFADTPLALIIPEGVTEIGEYAFNGCVTLSNIVLPKSMRRVSKRAFRNCPNLKFIVSKAGGKSLLNLPKH